VKFIDEAIITVESGDGGRGCVSFRRERFVPRGGPDGGDGGRGGDVLIAVGPGRRTLYPFRFKRAFKAANGAPGQGKNKSGRSGTDLVIEVPLGTVIREADSGRLLKDLVDPDDRFIAAKGGRGGQGNARFKTATHRAPRFAQPGESGQSLKITLELKLLADVGIIGLPNAGKSTLLGYLSAAKPKVANYPFTTLTPSLGVVTTDWGDPFIMADIPGLIEGAHQGTGLGAQFLKHIERTRLLLHLIDADAIDPQAPLEAFETVNSELVRFNPELGRKTQLIVLNKMDLSGTAEKAAAFKNAIASDDLLTISARERTNRGNLLSAILSQLDRIDDR
jgi:GTP-binding protein